MRHRERGSNRARLVALAIFIALIFIGCAEDAPQDFLSDQAGPNAERADDLWDITFGIAVAVFVIVEGLLVYAIIRFRARPDREAAQFHGNPRLEVVLTIVPALILTGLAVPTVREIFNNAREIEGALPVKVIGHQFWWEYRYDADGDGEEEVVTANELHIPVGQPIRLTLEGDVINADVIHSFWVPRLGGTQDLIPGRINKLTLQADEPGVFLGQCKEFCGLSHANMKLRVYADEPSDFEDWLADQEEDAEPPNGPLSLEGEDLFVNGTDGGQFANGPACATCHTIGGLEGAVGTLGPNLTHLASRDTFAGAMFELEEAELRDWLANPPAVKPGSRMPDLGLTGEEIDALVQYLMQLK